MLSGAEKNREIIPLTWKVAPEIRGALAGVFVLILDLVGRQTRLS